MRKRALWFIIIYILVACSTPKPQPTEQAMPSTSTYTVEAPTATLLPTNTAVPTITPTPNCINPFHAYPKADPALLHFRAQQAQTFSQEIFQTMEGQCPSFDDNFDSGLRWRPEPTSADIGIEDGVLYLRPNPSNNTGWIGIYRTRQLQARNFILEVKIIPRVKKNLNAMVELYWSGGSCAYRLFIYPARQYWGIDRCNPLSEGETKEVFGDQPIIVTIVKYLAYTAVYFNHIPMDSIPTNGNRPDLGFAVAGQGHIEIGFDYIRLWEIQRSNDIDNKPGVLQHPKLTLPEIITRLDFSKVPPIPGSFSTMPNYQEQDMGEMRMIKDGGFSQIRYMLLWTQIERKPGVYDFSLPDILFEYAAREKIALHLMPHFYDAWSETFPYPDLKFPPIRPDDKALYLNFLQAATQHYSNRGVVWEVSGEPGYSFTNISSYVDLVGAMIPVIRANDPSGLIVAPSIDHPESVKNQAFLYGLGEANLLCQLDAVGLSAYVNGRPESNEINFFNVRKIVDSFCSDKYIPLAVNEWGYSRTDIGDNNYTKYTVRMQLYDLLHDIPFTTLYEWRNSDDGVVGPVLELSPAYTAMQTLSSTLNGFEFVRRIPTEVTDYVLLFRKDGHIGLALWTTGSEHSLTLPIACDSPQAVDMLGNDFKVSANNSELSFSISDAPEYIVCQEKSQENIIFWKPIHNVQSVGINKPNVIVEANNTTALPIVGKFVLKSDAFRESSLTISLEPGQSAVFEIPVPLSTWSARILPVQLDFVVDNGSVQSAMLWLSEIAN